MIKKLLFLALVGGTSLYGQIYGQFGSETTQLPAPEGSVVRFDSQGLYEGLAVSPDQTKILIKESGIYFVMVEGEVGATTPGVSGYIDLWLEQNDKIVLDSLSRISIPNSETLITNVFNSIIEAKAGDTIRVKLVSSSPSLGLLYLQPDNEPAMASIVLTLWKISDIKANKNVKK